MATKDSFLSSKKTFVFSNSSNSDSQYSNLNLNQNNLCSKIAPIHSKINDPLNSKKGTVSNKVTDNFNHKESQIGFANESDNQLNGILSNLYNPNVKNSKSIQNYSTTTKSNSSNNSTLSLHIAAYENANSAASNFNENNDSKDSEKKSWKNIKQTFADSKTTAKDSFEIPRQQPNGTRDPEIMQFKASQILLNPNQQPPVTAEYHNISASKAAKAKKNENFVTVNGRVRPLSNSNDESCLDCDSANRMITVKDIEKKRPDKHFHFDKVFDEKADQELIFNDVAVPIIDGFIDGINGTIFAYGQTGSGKTFSMIGPDIENPGIIPRSIERIFDILEAEREEKPDYFEFTLKCSFLQIYNEKLYDLLQNNKDGLTIQSSSEKIIVNGAAEIEVNNFEKCMTQIQIGLSQRKTAETSMNQESSRSHAVLMLSLVTKSNKIVQRSARLNLVDLAGSERQSQTGNTGKQLLEAGSINNSLSTLARVIHQIINNEKHISHRDSKLTHLLLDSLGGNSKTSVLFNVHSNSQNVSQTVSTLNFAKNVKKVKNAAKINESIDCTENEAVKAENENLRQENVNLRSEVIILGQENGNLKSKNTQLETELQRMKDPAVESLLANTASFLTVEEIIKLQAELDSKKNEIDRLLKENDNVRKDDADKTFKIQELQDKIVELEEEISRLKRNDVPSDASVGGISFNGSDFDNGENVVEHADDSPPREDVSAIDQLYEGVMQAKDVKPQPINVNESDKYVVTEYFGYQKTATSTQFIVFDWKDPSKCYRYAKDDARFCCLGCAKAKNGSKSTLKIDVYDNGNKFAKVKNNHCCKPEEYEEISVETKTNFEIHSNGAGHQELVVFTSAEKEQCLRYHYHANDRFSCTYCFQHGKHVTAKFYENENYVKVDSNNSCQPSEYFESIIKPNFVKFENQSKMYLIFCKNGNVFDRTKGHVFTYYSNRYNCRTSKCKNYARIWEKDGIEYVQLYGRHVCEPYAVMQDENGKEYVQLPKNQRSYFMSEN